MEIAEDSQRLSILRRRHNIAFWTPGGHFADVRGDRRLRVRGASTRRDPRNTGKSENQARGEKVVADAHSVPTGVAVRGGVRV